MPAMRAIIWVIRLLLFFLLFGFAIKNDQLVMLNFFFGSQSGRYHQHHFALTTGRVFI